MLEAARTAAWAEEEMSLPGRWVAAYAAAYRYARTTWWGPIAIPHMIDLERITF